MKNLFFNINPLYENNFVYNELQQKILITNWLELYKKGTILEDPFQYGFKTFSQTNEDGILLYIFTIIGSTNKKVIEIGINCDNSRSNIPESIATNLISFHGWHGLLIDGNINNSGQILHHFHLNRSCGYYFFNQQKEQANIGSSLLSPLIRNHYITPKNINKIIEDNGFSGEIDLLSVDIDSADYHVIKSIDSCNPRVLMIETDGGKIDYDTSVTIKENPFDESSNEYAEFNKKISEFMLAGFSGTMSLKAAVNLAKRKGYRLATLSSGGWNAFFIRNDIGINNFQEISIEDAYKKIPAIYSFKERNELWTFDDLNNKFPNLFIEV